jgi:hypothetical protein
MKRGVNEEYAQLRRNERGELIRDSPPLEHIET